MKKNNMRNAGKIPRGAVKPLDLAVLALVLSLTLFSLIPAYGGSGEVRAQVMGGGRSWVFPLAAAERLAVPGPLGETVVEIRDGRARIVSSPCMNQICVAAGAVHTPGQWTACLPNRVMVSISGSGREADGEVDAASW